ncbi:hypothetical protein Tco_0722801 [Tanacetum coccineum]
MRTRRSNYPNNSNVTIPRRQRKQVSNIVEPEIRTIVEMAERTMEELLRDLRMGAGETIVYQKKSMLITLEIKTNLLQLVQRSFSVVEREKSSCSILLVSKGLPRLYDLACPIRIYGRLTQVIPLITVLTRNEQTHLMSRRRSNASRMNATSSKTDERIDKLADQLSTLVEIVSKKFSLPLQLKAGCRELALLVGVCTFLV